MVEIINIRGNTVSVRDDLAARATVCTRCKGFKAIARTLVEYSPFFRLFDYVRCPQCGGRGLFYEAER